MLTPTPAANGSANGIASPAPFVPPGSPYGAPFMGTLGTAASPAPAHPARANRWNLIRGLLQELNRLSTTELTERNNTVMNSLTDLLLRDAVRERATDIHLDPLRDGVH